MQGTKVFSLSCHVLQGQSMHLPARYHPTTEFSIRRPHGRPMQQCSSHHSHIYVVIMFVDVPGASPVRPQYVQIRPPLSADVPGASTVRPNLSTSVRGRPRRVPGASPVRPQYVQTRSPLSVDVPGASPVRPNLSTVVH
ncbi:uncharacterized protein BDZ83DRAFT_407865 [Colletotrichum acutatum]|uniref:Uncharacterized protein n=1 Tax=Glomerella acutata TaxID=27357 RepID=A0AAD8UFD4_GLOAC|nr:uncharacterized protein BDZ83DRAFT_407865 [Colletotrichum acutatum]KAK1722901.1 hypothetical protein BDZ83DRAFT_407865 [Colletotrichum acutatum]